MFLRIDSQRGGEPDESEGSAPGIVVMMVLMTGLMTRWHLSPAFHRPSHVLGALQFFSRSRLSFLWCGYYSFLLPRWGHWGMEEAGSCPGHQVTHESQFDSRKATPRPTFTSALLWQSPFWDPVPAYCPPHMYMTLDRFLPFGKWKMAFHCQGNAMHWGDGTQTGLLPPCYISPKPFSTDPQGLFLTGMN